MGSLKVQGIGISFVVSPVVDTTVNGTITVRVTGAREKVQILLIPEKQVGKSDVGTLRGAYKDGVAELDTSKVKNGMYMLAVISCKENAMKRPHVARAEVKLEVKNI